MLRKNENFEIEFHATNFRKYSPMTIILKYLNDHPSLDTVGGSINNFKRDLLSLLNH